jgi:molecular chaperone DnaK
MLLDDARKAMKEEAPLERLRSLTSELQQVFHSLGSASAAQGSPGGPSGPGNGSPDRPDAPVEDDDIIDAEFSAS